MFHINFNSMNIANSKMYKWLMPYLYGWGASLVIAGALFGTSAIAMAWFSGGWVIAPMVLFFFVALMVQNRTEKKEESDATS